MKKLLVLMLVLGMATAANATLQLYIDGSPIGSTLDVVTGTTARVQVHSNDATSYGGYLVLDDPGSDGALGNAAPTANAGDMGSMDAYSYAGWGIGYTITTARSPSGTITAGVQHEADWDTSALDIGDSATVSLYDSRVSYYTPVDTLVMTVIVPEPMTIGLLGLGGLFLVRRRK
jgi:hypothetical protein